MVKTNSAYNTSILIKTFGFLSGYALFLILTISGGVYYITSSLERINQSAIEFDDLSREVETVNDYFVHQAKDRKNLFLRGHNEEDLQKYLGRINEMTAKIHQKIDEISKNSLSSDYQDKLNLFANKHHELMKTYLQGVKILQSTQDYQKSDRFVRGYGKKVEEELLEVIQQIKADRQDLLQENKKNIRNFLLISTSGLLLIILAYSGVLILVITDPIRRIVRFTNFLDDSRQTDRARLSYRTR